MNDRFLSRGKSKGNGEWAVGYYCPTVFTRFPCKPSIYPAETINHHWHAVEIIPETLGGCTGATDKNDKLIFEGDIVTYGDTDNRYYGNYAVVFEQRGGCAYFGIKINDNETWQFCLEVHPKIMEVIGNIHDNPELLESEVAQ